MHKLFAQKLAILPSAVLACHNAARPVPKRGNASAAFAQYIRLTALQSKTQYAQIARDKPGSFAASRAMPKRAGACLPAGGENKPHNT